MSATLDRLPPLATAGVGSLPFAAPGEAARHALAAYALPFCPQLPRLDGDMVREWLGADPGGCGWTADRDRERPAAWESFLAQAAARPPGHRVVKLQVTGPWTLAIALEGAPATGLARDLAAWLAANAAAQVRRLADAGLDAVVVVDEPGVGHGGAVAPDVWEPFRALGRPWGLHVCGWVPWRLVAAAEPDVLSFDLVREGLPRAARPMLRALMARGGRVAWGVVDPTGSPRAADASALATAAMSALGLPLDEVARHSLLTPTCGTGRVSPRQEHLVAATLAACAAATHGAVLALTGEAVGAASA